METEIDLYPNRPIHTLGFSNDNGEMFFLQKSFTINPPVEIPPIQIEEDLV